MSDKTSDSEGAVSGAGEEYDTLPMDAFHPSAAHLVVLIGEEVGMKYMLDRDVITFGRSSDCEIHLPYSDISRVHARLSRCTDGKLLLTDLRSQNGTRVNGESISEHVLRIGDMIAVGHSVVMILTEKAPLQEQILQLQKMESIGQLSSGIAHDFNNLLTVVMNNARFLRHTTSPEEQDICLSEIEEAVGRGAKLSRQLLTFARKETIEGHPVAISEVIKDALSLTDHGLLYPIKVSTWIEPGLTVIGDRLQFYQVFMNLLINARDAMMEGGVLSLEARKHSLDDEAAAEKKLRPGEYVQVTVKDTGIGMDEETCKKVFDPFFTTKSDELGTGLGLSLSRNIVNQSGGHIEVESRVGHGTSFSIYLPMAKVVPGGQKEIRTSKIMPGEGCIMVADDDDLVRNSTMRLLTSLGYRTLGAENGKKAMELYRQEPGVVLVILDLVMPELGGEETFHGLREIDPNVQVLLFSGHYQQDAVKKLRDAGALGFIPKPATSQELAMAIHAAISD